MISKPPGTAHRQDCLLVVRYGWRIRLWPRSLPFGARPLTAPSRPRPPINWWMMLGRIFHHGESFHSKSLDPKWKVLTVDAQSPIRKDFDATQYPLQITFSLQGNQASAFSLPTSNRDASKLTTVILTGTTSLVNGIAYQMEVKGLDYPAQDIGDVLRQADILHVSNKTSFALGCPAPNPDQLWPRCSDPKYIQLLVDVGVKVVELTGPHILDDGVEPFLYTLNLYKQNNIQTYGGGANLAEARQPLLIEIMETRSRSSDATPENILSRLQRIIHPVPIRAITNSLARKLIRCAHKVICQLSRFNIRKVIRRK